MHWLGVLKSLSRFVNPPVAHLLKLGLKLLEVLKQLLNLSELIRVWLGGCLGHGHQFVAIGCW